MNTIADFFRRHHAVPANDCGPKWTQCTEEQLLDWFMLYASIVRVGWNREANRASTPAEREAARPLYEEICGHIRTRANQPDASAAIRAADLRIDWPAYGSQP